MGLAAAISTLPSVSQSSAFHARPSTMTQGLVAGGIQRGAAILAVDPQTR